tara:strand:+ start:832 stop:2097 length:1266 start_codon:yes stop_codon:yes gene_type:complete
MIHTQSKAFEPGTFGQKNPVTFDKSRVETLCENTARLLSTGAGIPIFDDHPQTNHQSRGPQIDKRSKTKKAINAVGWLRGIEMVDGVVNWDMDIQDPDYSAAIKNKTIRRSSPEIGSYRKNFKNSKGENFGEVIRHVALTAFPKNQGQDDIVALSDGDEGDTYYQMSDTPMVEDSSDGTTSTSEPTNQPSFQQDNPNMPEDQEKAGKCEALIAQLAELGVCLPVGTDLAGDGWIDVMLAATMTAVESERKLQAKEVQDEANAPDVITEPQPVTQLGETEDMSKIEKLQAIVNKQNRDALTVRLNSASIPDGIRSVLSERVAIVQFSDSEDGEDFIEDPVFTLSDVLEMVETSIPDSLKNAGVVTQLSETVTQAELGVDAASDEEPQTDAEKAAKETPAEAKAKMGELMQKMGYPIDSVLSN